jgi:hypothetical protein
MFSSDQLVSSESDIAQIPWSRLFDFVDGEGMKLPGKLSFTSKTVIIA